MSGEKSQCDVIVETMLQWRGEGGGSVSINLKKRYERDSQK